MGGQILADVAAAYIFNAQARVDAIASADALRHRALHDPLTKLPNRTLMEDRLKLALAKSRRTDTGTGLLFVDLDRFKAVNDTYGHLVGDRLLIAVAHRLSSTLRPGDTLARVAGDEFLVICEGVSDLEHAEQIAARIHAVLEAPFAIEPNSVTDQREHRRCGRRRPRRACRGPDPARRRARSMRPSAAAGAGRRARQRGRGRRPTGGSTWSATSGGRSTSASSSSSTSRSSSSRRGVPRASRRCCGGRTRSSARSPRPTIVASAERTGLIRDLGTWVIRTACEQLRDWSESGVAVNCVCVNVAAAEFVDPAYCLAVESVCAAAGIAPQRLCLEITESVLIDDVPGALAAFDGLKRVGVQLALDDFGTGYSSLSYLKRFPVDMVKIDQTFVAGIHAEPLDEAIVTAVIGLAHAIGMTVVAEGVEEPRQHAAVTKLGCDLAQGYLFARPMGADAVSEHLETSLTG